jgi:muconolactone D-isomerase
MLYQVRMDVHVPHHMEVDRSELLKAEEKARAQELQRQGKWRYLWRVAGQYSNISIFDVADHDELHAVLSTLPLFPFMAIQVAPLAHHPSAVGYNGPGRHRCLD